MHIYSLKEEILVDKTVQNDFGRVNFDQIAKTRQHYLPHTINLECKKLGGSKVVYQIHQEFTPPKFHTTKNFERVFALFPILTNAKTKPKVAKVTCLSLYNTAPERTNLVMQGQTASLTSPHVEIQLV